MSAIRTLLLAPMLLAGLTVACGEQPTGGDHDQLTRDFASSDPQAVPEEFRALLPDDTLLYVQARSARALSDAFASLSGGPAMVGPLGDVDAGSMVSRLSPAGGLTGNDVELDKPMAFALAWPEDADEPQMMTFFHRNEFSDVEARLDAAFVFAREGRATRALLRGDEAFMAPKSGESQVGSQLAAGDLSAWVDLQATLNHPRALAAYDAMVALMKMQMGSPPPGMPNVENMGKLMELYTTVIRESFTEFARLDLGLRAIDGVMQAHAEVLVFEDSALADIPSPDDNRLEELLALLDPEATLRGVFRADYSGVRERSVPLLTTLALKDEALAELFGLFLSGADAFDGTQALEFRGLSGFQLRSFVSSETPTASVAEMLEVIPQMGSLMSGTTYSQPEVIDVDGVEVKVIRVEDIGDMMRATPDNPLIGNLENQTSALFTHEGMVVTVQTTDREEIADAVRSTLALLESKPELDPALASALTRFDDFGAGGYLHLEFAPIFREFAALMGAPAPDSNERPAMTFFVGNRGPLWSFDASVDVAGMVRMMR